jgi:hypothetical protein
MNNSPILRELQMIHDAATALRHAAHVFHTTSKDDLHYDQARQGLYTAALRYAICLLMAQIPV